MPQQPTPGDWRKRLRKNPLIRLFSSIWLGVSLLFLILLYASIMSALPQARGAVEMTEMEAFDHWIFGTLIALFCIALTTATIIRIRLNAINAGVLTVHTGLLLLTGGSWWYFGGKIEGDLHLRTPRVQILSTGMGGERVLDEMPAIKGQTWSQFAPMLGGEIRLAVMDAKPEGLESAGHVTVGAVIDGAQPRMLELDPDATATAALNDKVSVRLKTFPPERKFYNKERAALFYRKVNGVAAGAPPAADVATASAAAPGRHDWEMVEIRGLPIFRERYLGKETLRDTEGRPVPSKRTSPVLKVAGVPIPTGWFEHWRMPIELDTPGLPFDVKITGFVPYLARVEPALSDGGTQENPAIRLRLAAGRESLERSLFANSPARSMLDTQTPIEFRWIQSEAERDALLRPLAGPHELYIEVKDPPVTQTLAISEGQVIKVEGTPYELTVQSVSPSWPMMTPGYEGAGSPMASVDVTNGEKSYNRTVIQRFPELSQDIDEQGTRHREPYDPNLVLRYRTAANGWALVTAGPDLPPVLGIFDPDGAVRREALRVLEPKSITLAGARLSFEIAALVRRAREDIVPVIEPLERRRPNLLPRSVSAVRFEFSGRGEHQDWSESRWCLFSFYPNMPDEIEPIFVQLPGESEKYELVYSRLEHDLGGQLGPGRLIVSWFPGQRGVESWRSEYLVQMDGSDQITHGSVYTNQTDVVGQWTLFQSTADGRDHWKWTGLGVGNRKGIWPMVLGCCFITIGCLYAFYVKPVLLRRRSERAKARTAQADQQPKFNGRPGARPRPDLVEVGS